MTKQKTAAIRTREVLAAGLALAEQKGYQVVTRDDLAAAADLSAAHVSGLFGTMHQFRRALMRCAIHQKRLQVIAQGMAVKDPNCAKLPAGLAELVANYIKG